MAVRYQPAVGDGRLTFANDSTVLVVDTPAEASFVDAVWTALHDDDPVAALLDLLTGRGLSSTPPFALVSGTDPVRVIVRGSLEVSGDELSLTGEGVSTWVERSLTGIPALRIETGADPSSVAGLPLLRGVTLAASIELTLDTAASTPVVALPSSPAPTPAEPAALPEPPAPEVERAVEPDDSEHVDSEADDATLVSDGDGFPSAPEPSAPPTTAVPAADDAADYDYLFGATVFRSVQDAAVREEEPAEDAAPADAAAVSDAPAAAAAAAPSAPTAGDHDGLTVAVSEIQRLRTERAAGASAPRSDASAAPRFVLELPDGGREPFEGAIVVGRAPSAVRVTGAMPRLITLGDGDQDISRNHARFTLEGDTPVVTDLQSKNGTTIVLPGKSPQRLRGGESAAVLDGTVIDLGGVVSVRVASA